MDASKELLGELAALQNPRKAVGAAKFFQARPGGYGEGDIFWGLNVPDQRVLSRRYYKLLEPAEVAPLLRHEVHEVRLCALMVLALQFQKARDDAQKAAIAQIYRENLPYVNNWDLVDSSAPQILGAWCVEHGAGELAELARSGNLWAQRVAMVATQAFIRAGNFAPVLEIAEILLQHKHDLIHKAVGWMLREMGNRDHALEYGWLLKHYRKMPRTMLRYAIEKFAEPVRQGFLKGTL